MIVRKNPSTGKWDAQYSYTDWQGKRKKTTKRGFRTKREAVEWYDHFRATQDADFNMVFKDFIEIYADIVHTGDDVLDMVLTEKNLLCRAQQIQINCVADGKLLYFIRPADVYTIFSVAIGNAMQEVAAFPETEKRLIDISIGKRQNFLFINVFNPLFHKENAADPLSRPMEEQPAYELRTIKKIVSDYHGLMKVDVFHDTFSLNIMIPFPQKQ